MKKKAGPAFTPLQQDALAEIKYALHIVTMHLIECGPQVGDYGRFVHDAVLACANEAMDAGHTAGLFKTD